MIHECQLKFSSRLTDNRLKGAALFIIARPRRNVEVGRANECVEHCSKCKSWRECLLTSKRGFVVGFRWGWEKKLEILNFEIILN